MRSERTSPLRRYAPGLIFLLLGTVAGAWHNHATDRGKTDLVAGAVRGVVAPPSTALGRVSRWASEQTGWLFHGHVVSEENRRLKARVAQLEAANIQFHEAQINVDRLRADLGFVQANRPHLLAADVVTRRPDPKFDTMIISRGSRDGVTVHSVVVTRNGVVGQVHEVGPTTASVILITDQNQNSPGVGATVQRSRVTGVSKGDAGGMVALDYLRNDADVKKGDLIVTSGNGGVYPPGLLVGTVVEVRSDEGNLNRRARVKPAVDFDRLEEVYVLK
jgi:rod shape-determining protein MreC